MPMVCSEGASHGGWVAPSLTGWDVEAGTPLQLLRVAGHGVDMGNLVTAKLQLRAVTTVLGGEDSDSESDSSGAATWVAESTSTSPLISTSQGRGWRGGSAGGTVSSQVLPILILRGAVTWRGGIV